MAAKRAKATRKAPAKKQRKRANPTARKTAKKKRPAKRKKVGKKKATKRVAKKRPRKAAAKKPAPAKAAAEVVKIHRYTELSIAQLSLDTGSTRATIAKRIADSNVQPSNKVRGYPVYRLADILPALFQSTEGVVDPDKLKPFERRAFYQGEHDKLKLEIDRGELVPRIEVEQEFARLFKLVTQRLETLPDLLERDVGANVRQLTLIEKIVDELREDMHDTIANGNEHVAGAAKKRA